MGPLGNSSGSESSVDGFSHRDDAARLGADPAGGATHIKGAKPREGKRPFFRAFSRAREARRACASGCSALPELRTVMSKSASTQVRTRSLFLVLVRAVHPHANGRRSGLAADRAGPRFPLSEKSPVMRSLFCARRWSLIAARPPCRPLSRGPWAIPQVLNRALTIFSIEMMQHGWEQIRQGA